MLLNSLFSGPSIIGIIGLSLFIIVLGCWFAVLYGGKVTLVNFLLSCFFLLSLSITLIGFVIYFMIFSSLVVWIYFGLLPILLIILEKIFKTNFSMPNEVKIGIHQKIRSVLPNYSAVIKIIILIVIVFSGFIVEWIARTGNALFSVSEVVSLTFWPILGLSFFMLYIISNDKSIAKGAKLICMFLVAFLIFSAPSIVYSNYITEDSFGLFGVAKSIISTGIYGWVPHLARTGYFAITSMAAISSSSLQFIDVIYKFQTPLLASIYLPLFIYLILERITKKSYPFLALASLLIFPNLLFVSVPLEKSIATVFFMGCLWLSLLLLEKENLRKIDILTLSLVLLAVPFIHDYFGFLSALPIIITLFLRITNFGKSKRSILVLGLIITSAILIIPSSFVINSLLSNSTNPIIFVFPNLNDIINFLFPSITIPASVNSSLYFYQDNFFWVRYLVFTVSSILIATSIFTSEPKKTKIWLMIMPVTFWVGYFLLKTSVQNPPESAKDYRFGFFVDLTLIPLVCVALSRLYLKLDALPNRLKELSAKRIALFARLPKYGLVFLLIFITIVSIYSGYNFDKIMERPIDVKYYGRYAVTDEKIQVMQFIQNESGSNKLVILSDAHMGQIAQGYLPLNFEKTELFYLNSGGALYTYFNLMRKEPSRLIMNDLMNKTNSEIGFFIIGLNDWVGWLPETAYWIDSRAIDELKNISDEWAVFGQNNDFFVFIFR